MLLRQEGSHRSFQPFSARIVIWGGMEGTSSTLIGVAISVLSNSVVALGMNVLKLAHIKLQHQHNLILPSLPTTTSTTPTTGKRRVRVDKAFLASPIWWMGQSLMTLGECGNFVRLPPPSRRRNPLSQISN